MKRVALVLAMISTPLVLCNGFASAQTPFNPKSIEAACAAAAKAEPAKFPPGTTKMWCAMIDREGKANCWR